MDPKETTMSNLKQTNGGSWAKQTTTKRGQWQRIGSYGSEEAAERAAAPHREKGRKVSIERFESGKSRAKKLGVDVGSPYWRVKAYIVKHKPIMTHASAAECEAAGKQPGPMNQ